MSRRMMYDAFVFFDDDNFTCYTNPTSSQAASLMTLHKAFGPGAYEWIGKTTAPQSYASCYLGFEFRHGTPTDGIIAFISKSDGTYSTLSATNGATTCTRLNAQDWTQDTAFQIDWDLKEITFRVDDFVVSTHHRNVPSSKMMFFFEAVTDRKKSPASKPFCYLKKCSFSQLR